MIDAPTAAQIAQVQTNLANMQALNDWLHSDGQDKIANAFALFAEGDLDPDTPLLLDIFSDIFAILGLIPGVGTAIAVAGTIMTSVVKEMAANPPGDLLGSFATFIDNFNAVWRAIDLQLAVYHDDVAGHWSDSFTAPDGSSATLSGLASESFPAETDPSFEQIGNAASAQFDRGLWLAMFTHFGYMWQESDHLYMHGEQGYQPATPEDFVRESLTRSIYAYYPGAPMWDGGQWMASIFTIYGRGGYLNEDSCKYIFMDNPQQGYADALSNPNGLWLKSQLWPLLPHSQP